MTTAGILSIAASVILISAGAIQESGKPNAKPAAKSAADRLVEKPAADLTWTDLDPKGAPGVQIADVWGNHAKGAFGAFLKFPAGFAAPLHTHTNDYKVVILSGTFIQGPEGGAEFRLFVR